MLRFSRSAAKTLLLRVRTWKFYITEIISIWILPFVLGWCSYWGPRRSRRNLCFCSRRGWQTRAFNPDPWTRRLIPREVQSHMLRDVVKTLRDLPWLSHTNFKKILYDSNKGCYYIARLSLNKLSTVIGWFLVMCPWSNSNVSRLGYTIAQLLPARRLRLFVFSI